MSVSGAAGGGAGRGASVHPPRSPQRGRRDPRSRAPAASEGTGLPPPRLPSVALPPPTRAGRASPQQLLGVPPLCPEGLPARRGLGAGGEAAAAASLAWGNHAVLTHPPPGFPRCPAGPLPLAAAGRGRRSRLLPGAGGSTGGGAGEPGVPGVGRPRHLGTGRNAVTVLMVNQGGGHLLKGHLRAFKRAAS